MSNLLETLELAPFRQRFPWLGADLQTLRDTLRPMRPKKETSPTREFGLASGDRLLARLDSPLLATPRALVIVVHGLGGGSDDEGQRRLSRSLVDEGFVVLRLNLRGAGPGRPLATGTYAANCSADLLPVLRDCRRLATALASQGDPLPLGAVGVSLGGTVLLNALLDTASDSLPLLDGLVAISSPLDLTGCADYFDRPRNRLYQRWMVRRLIGQTLNDPLPLPSRELARLTGSLPPRSLRDFDALITAPRWGFADVSSYYEACSPLSRLLESVPASTPRGERRPPLLLLHARDDPWVPVDATLTLEKELAGGLRRVACAEDRPWPEVVITPKGGHCGFHAPGDTLRGRWSDRLAARWLRRALARAEGGT